MYDVSRTLDPLSTTSSSDVPSVAQQLAMSVGIAVVGTALFDRLGGRVGPGAFVDAAQRGLVVAAGFLVAAAIAVLWLPHHARDGAGH